MVVAGWQRCLRGLIDLVVDQSGFAAAPFLKTDGASSLITVKTTMRAIVLVDDVVGDNPSMGAQTLMTQGRIKNRSGFTSSDLISNGSWSAYLDPDTDEITRVIPTMCTAEVIPTGRSSACLLISMAAESVSIASWL